MDTRLNQAKKNFKLIIQKLKKRAKELKQNITLLYRVYKHTNTP